MFKRWGEVWFGSVLSGALMILEDAGLLKPGIHLCLQGDSWTKSPTSLVATGPRQCLAPAGCNSSSGGPAYLPELCSVREAHGWTGPGWLGQNSYDSFISHFPGHLGSPDGMGLCGVGYLKWVLRWGCPLSLFFIKSNDLSQSSYTISQIRNTTGLYET